ncbi:protein-tyrosine phosphatase-like protein [Aspergillus karnatakaensis]|uniref:dual specificity protein phosphatase family protein n=1 Tax=Aspergillus karnatakaensis TaxID=1810916 RepID=UPI003CCE2FFE
MGSADPQSEIPVLGNNDSQYVRTHKYTKRLANPDYPHISYNGYTPPLRKPMDQHSHRFAEGEFVSSGFFQRVDPRDFDLPHGEVEWSYSLRRTAQRILPFLYLGPWSCLANRKWLKDEGITLLFGVRDQRLARMRAVSGQKAAAEVGIQADSFDITSNQDLIARLPQAIRHINDHLSSNEANLLRDSLVPKKILVFCETGNGLSALVVIAYLMVMLDMNLPEAINFLHGQRFCIDLEESVKPLLGAFQGILEAKRDVEAARRSTAVHTNLGPPTLSLSKKRSFADRAEDGYMEDSTTERKPSAPFQDRWE